MKLKCYDCEEMFEEKDGERGIGREGDEVFACSECAYEVKYESRTPEELAALNEI